MATRAQQTNNYQQIFWCVLLVFFGLLGRWGYLKISNVHAEYRVSNVQKKIAEKDAELKDFSNKPGYDKLQYVQDLEENNTQMPRSNHVNAIMSIFKELLNVDKSDTFNISFSNFEISLDHIRLDGYVTNLRLLYMWGNSKPWLISRFEKLSFLDNISIKTYEKDDWGLWYNFTLTANVINNGK